MGSDSNNQFAKTYEPRDVERRWYELWVDRGYFTPTPGDGKEPFSIVIPPPNVTGSLHIGHALNNTLQDILVRYKRMKGFSVLWVPGTDHAGIATQLVVERDLERSGSTTRHDLGRERFIERVWEWKQGSGDTITNQLRRLGVSADWTRERFTMDDGLSSAVRRVFVELYREGLIYRDKRLVNWDPMFHTAISDLEVEQREVRGHLWHFRYPLEDEPTRFITVATTRPETMLGDTAVAVHPADERYAALVGRSVVLPIVGRVIPIIADEYSDPEKGTGAVKITPAHDFNDFEVGARHGLEKVNIFDQDAALNANVPVEYRGLDRFVARKKIVEEMDSLGLLAEVEDHVHSVPYGDRSGTVLEPLLTDQWYVDTVKLAGPAIEAAEQGKVTFVPQRWVNTYYEWMRNIQPWCISRQIWWGHQIPVWYGPDGETFVAETEQEAIEAAGEHYGEGVELKRDEDVLDTWFSSALWPFSTLGWPGETEELATWYPTSVLVTAFDIIFFWVARMIMMGLRFRGEVPFREVYIHGLIRDEVGEKMSKTKGNVIDPLEICDRFGADSLRFSLAALATQGGDIKLTMPVIEGYRNFMNKTWNASRFVCMNLEGYDPDHGTDAPLSSADRWILTKLSYLVREYEGLLAAYEFDKAAHGVYQFIWGDFCDWYIEMVKPVLTGDDPAPRRRTQSVLGRVLLASLQLLHPFSPFITEEIFQRMRALGFELTGSDGSAVESIMMSALPSPESIETDDEASSAIEFVKEVIAAVRSLRAVIGLHPASTVNITLYSPRESVRELVLAEGGTIKLLGRVAGMTVAAEEDEKPHNAIAQVIGELEIFLHVDGTIDIEHEVERLGKEIAKLDLELGAVEKKLANAKFIERAPEEIVLKERAKLEDSTSRRRRLGEVLVKLREIGGG